MMPDPARQFEAPSLGDVLFVLVLALLFLVGLFCLLSSDVHVGGVA